MKQNYIMLRIGQNFEECDATKMSKDLKLDKISCFVFISQDDSGNKAWKIILKIYTKTDCMKLFIAAFFLLFFSTSVFASITAPFPNTTSAQTIDGSVSISTFASLKMKEVEKLIGRKLKLKEKIAVKIAQWKIRNEIEKDDGKTAQLLGILGAASLFIPFINLASIPLSILAVVIGSKAKRKDPTNRKARTGVTLGIATLAFILVIGLIVALVLTIGQFPM